MRAVVLLAVLAASVFASVAGAVLGVVVSRQPAPPQQPYIWTDAWSGKQYVVNPAGGLWARVNDQGRHMDMWEQPR
jgi:hypothetical protein